VWQILVFLLNSFLFVFIGLQLPSILDELKGEHVDTSDLLVSAAPAAAQFSPDREARNYSKINERAAEYSTPEYQTQLRRRSAENQAETTRIKAEDPERNFDATLCSTRNDGCAGDVRLYDWELNGHGLSRPVLFTARNGAVISGHVWATRSGPAKRPGIVITDGSVQAPEQL
jgi:hypothetical protein